MPQLIHHIDEIARHNNRDVLMVSFPELGDLIVLDRDLYAPRIEFIDFLKKHKIKWLKCAPPRSQGGWIIGYFGEIYLDVPFNPKDPKYQLLQGHLELEDGSPRDPRVRLWLMPLKEAIRIGQMPDLDIFE